MTMIVSLLLIVLLALTPNVTATAHASSSGCHRATPMDMTTNSTMPRALLSFMDYCHYVDNIALDNKVYRTVKGPSSSCCALCKDDQDCHGYTWTDHQGGMCHLGASLLPLSGTVQRGAFSAVMMLPGWHPTLENPTPVPQYMTKPSCDMYGNDIRSILKTSFARCALHCYSQGGCVAFTFVAQGGRCYLKNDVVPCSPTEGMATGIMLRF